MQVTVRFLGALRDTVGAPSLSVDLPENGTYRDVLDAIDETLAGRLPNWAWDPQGRTFSRRMMVSRNGTADLRDESTRLDNGDEILVVLPLAGG